MMSTTIPRILSAADQLLLMDCEPGSIGVASDPQGLTVAWLRIGLHGEPCVFVTDWDADNPEEMMDSIEELTQLGTGTLYKADTLQLIGMLPLPTDINGVQKALSTVPDGTVLVAGELTSPEHTGQFVLMVRSGGVWLTTSCGPTITPDTLRECDEAEEADLDPDADSFLTQLREVVATTGTKPTARLLAAANRPA